MLPSLFSHPLVYTNPTILMDAKQQALTLFNFCLPCLAFFITIIDSIIPLTKPFIFVNIIIIIPYFYLLLCHKPIWNILQRIRVVPHCIMKHFLCFEMIRDILQLPWVFSNDFIAYLLRLKVVWNKTQGV